MNAYYALLGVTKGVDKAKLAQVEETERKGAETAKQNRIDSNVASGLSYSSHVQDVGWQGERRNGQVAGTTGLSRRVEAIRVRLTGDLDRDYDVWYRVHAQDIGWMGWTKDGKKAGTQ